MAGKKSKFELKIVENVKIIRKSLSKPQTYIGMILDVSDGYIGQIESEKWPAMYTLDQLNKIALDFNCSPKDFMPIEGVVEDDSIEN